MNLSCLSHFKKAVCLGLVATWACFPAWNLFGQSPGMDSGHIFMPLVLANPTGSVDQAMVSELSIDRLALTPEGMLIGGNDPALAITPDGEWNGDSGAVAFWLKNSDWQPGDIDKNILLFRTSLEGEGSLMLIKRKGSEIVQVYATAPFGEDVERSTIARIHNSTEWPVGGWNHIAFSWRRGDFFSLFVNGVKVSGIDPGASFIFPESFTGFMFARGDETRGWGMDGTSLIRDFHFWRQPPSDDVLSGLASIPPSSQPTTAPQTSLKQGTPENRTPSTAGEVDIEEEIIPITKVAQPPVIDAVIKPDEYPSQTIGMVDLQGEKKVVSSLPITVNTAMDGNSIFIGATIEFDPSYSLISAASENHAKELVGRGDLFVVVIRSDSDLNQQNFSAKYITVAPNGVHYSANEEVDWASYTCKRSPEEQLVKAVASAVQPGKWTVELELPRAALKLDHGQRFALSLGFVLQGARLGMTNHLVWFDHPDAFVVAQPTEIGIRQNVRGLETGQPLSQISISNPSPSPVELNAEWKVSGFSSGLKDSTWIYDEMRAEGVVLRRGELIANGKANISVEAGKTETSGGLLDVSSRVGSDILFEKSVVTHGGDFLFRRKWPTALMGQLDVALIPLPAMGKIIVKYRISDLVSLLDGAEMRIELTGADGEQFDLGGFPVEFVVGQSPISIVDLPVGSYQAAIRFIDSNGGEIATTKADFTKHPAPPWLENRAGIEALQADWCPDPWVPVQAENGIVSVWGREFDLNGTSILQGITSQGESLLKNGGVKLVVKSGGKPEPIELRETVLREENKGRVISVKEGESRDFHLTVEQITEFDGFHEVKLKLTPKENTVAVEAVWVDIPLNPSFRPATQSGPLTQMSFVNNPGLLFFANDTVGIGFCMDTFAGGLIDSRRNRLEILEENGAKVLRVYLVNTPAEVANSLEMQFGLHPSPYRPLWENWRDLRPDGLGIMQLEGGANTWFLHSNAWSHGSQRPMPRNSNILKFLTDWAHHYGQRLFPYSCPLAFTPYAWQPTSLGEDWCFQKLLDATGGDPTRLSQWWGQMRKEAEEGGIYMNRTQDSFIDPDYEYFQEEWNVSPRQQAGSGNAETLGLNFMSPTGSWSDFYLHHIQQNITKTDVDGFYLDLATPRIKFMNHDPNKGMEWHTVDGVKEGQFEIFATRDLYKRLYHIFQKNRGEGNHPYVVVHGTGQTAGCSSLWDVVFAGEEFRTALKDPYSLSKVFRSKDLEVYPDKGGYSGHGFRAVFNSRVSGIPTVFLPNYSYHPANRTDKALREILSWAIVHNVPVWPYHKPQTEALRYWKNVEIPFKMGGSQFFPYYDNNIDTGEPAVKISYWKNPSTGEFLLGIANWSDEEKSFSAKIPREIYNDKSPHWPLGAGNIKFRDGILEGTLNRSDFEAMIFKENPRSSVSN